MSELLGAGEGIGEGIARTVSVEFGRLGCCHAHQRKDSVLGVHIRAEHVLRKSPSVWTVEKQSVLYHSDELSGKPAEVGGHECVGVHAGGYTGW